VYASSHAADEMARTPDDEALVALGICGQVGLSVYDFCIWVYAEELSVDVGGGEYEVVAAIGIRVCPMTVRNTPRIHCPNHSPEHVTAVDLEVVGSHISAGDGFAT